MKTIIKIDNNYDNEPFELELSDEHLDNENFVDISIIKKKEMGDDDVVGSYTVSVEDLEMALLPFIKLKDKLRKSYEKD